MIAILISVPFASRKETGVNGCCNSNPEGWLNVAADMRPDR